ncbi:MAG TPA: hypothetical protein VK421_01365 [Pyrinomonadaceae bacterium]|nr:hypothetical protein [Pyrinomonadaceae bacterium]
MFLQKRLRRAAALAVALSFSASALAAQEKTGKKNKPQPSGTPVLWRAPDDLPTRNLLLGPGGEAMRPDLSRVTFVKDETGGYSTKFRVRDGRGREWVAKVGKEAQSETAAVRLVWAVGYMTEINYLVPRLQVEGKGTFENVRLEARPEHVDRLDEWRWARNPFARTKELQGLIIMMALLNNWDIKDTNNKVLHVRDPRTGREELHYVVSDLGATFGRVKLDVPGFWRVSRSRNNPEDFSRDPFLEDVKRGQVFLFYKGKRQDLFDYIRVEEARWIASLLAKLSDRQIADAFRAANYSPAEVGMLTEAVRARINELRSVR